MTREQRSNCMRAVRCRDTLPEMIVRKWLFSLGYRFRVQYRKLPGKPDIALPKYKTLIEIRGCFWHRHKDCPIATMPKSNREFWRNKFEANVERDARHEREWAELGWKAIIIWECELKGERRGRTFERVLCNLPQPSRVSGLGKRVNRGGDAASGKG